MKNSVDDAKDGHTGSRAGDLYTGHNANNEKFKTWMAARVRKASLKNW